MKRCIFGLLGLFLAVTPAARADEIHDLLEKVSTEVTKTVEQHQGDAKKRGQFQQMADDVRALRENLSGEKINAVEATRVLRRLLTNTQLSTETKQAAGQMTTVLSAAADAERKAAGEVRSTDEAKQLDVILQKAAEACMAAKQEADLDPVLKELNVLRETQHGSGAAESRNFSRRESALRFLNRWQYYLRQRAAGYDDRAAEVIHEFLQNPPGEYPLLTREQMKSLLPAEPKIEALETLLHGVKNLDELPKLIADVGAVNSKRRSIDPGAAETGQSLTELNEVYKAHTAAKAGLYQNALQTATNILNNLSRPGSAELIRMKTMLLAEVLPAYLDLPGDVKPREGENPSQFLLRTADEGAAKGDWDRVQRVLDVYRTSAFGMRPPTWLQGEITACTAFLAAQKLENAGDFKRAAIEYEKVLLASGKRIPTAEATARLAKLGKEHPDALEAAGKAAEQPAAKPL